MLEVIAMVRFRVIGSVIVSVLLSDRVSVSVKVRVRVRVTQPYKHNRSRPV